MLFLFICTIFPLFTFAANKSGVEPQVISLPKGPGSIEGLGESFEPQLNTGTAVYSVKIKVSPGVNNHQPEVVLEYNNGYGNSSLGIGWDLNIPYIQRQTDKGLPSYTAGDTFIYSKSGELVPVGSDIFRLKIEGSFMKFKQTGDSWEAWEKNGTHLYFGTGFSSKLVTPHGTFKWFLERSVDTNGNEIRYYYQSDSGQVYLTEVRYSIMSDIIYKSVHFIYENRPDPFVDYHSRSKIETSKRLANIEVRSQNNLVRRYGFSYKQGADFSLLSQVTQYGADGLSYLPPVSFDYSIYNPENIKTVAMTNPPPYGITLTDGNTDLIDVNGDSLPDIVHTSQTEGKHYFYLNEGKGMWKAERVEPSASPQYFLSSNGVMMSDMDGDGLADLFVKDPFDFGYFKNKGNLTWEANDWVQCTPKPNFSFESGSTKLMDVNNDKLIDVVMDSGTSYFVWLNSKSNKWNTEFDYETVLPDWGHLSLASPNVRIADMNGDRMEDLVFVMDGYLSYFPSMGNGEFDREVIMNNPPEGIGYITDALNISDVNNDGLADVVFIGNGNIIVWFNAGNNVFRQSVTFGGTPAFISGISVFRFADMNGDGFRDILFIDGSAPAPYQYIDFNNGVHPNLLKKISNGLGMETSISYRSSTEDYLSNRDNGRPWITKLPFPIQTVSRIEVHDLNSGDIYTSEYFYRDGYYDGIEKEFRGFGEVSKVNYGEETAPTLVTDYVIDVGKEEESRKGMVRSVATGTENMTLNPVSGVFDIEENNLTTRFLLIGLNGEKVRHSFISAKSTWIYESPLGRGAGVNPLLGVSEISPLLGGVGVGKLLYQAFNQDNYGNMIQELNYGIVEGNDLSAGKDELLTYTTYLIDESKWILDLPTRIHKTDLYGNFVSLRKNSYDAKGNFILQEDSPDGTAFISTLRNIYDNYGNITKITDANEHWREIAYDPLFHTFPVSESIGGLGLTMYAAYDTGMGVVTSFSDFNGNVTSFGYDTFGRLTAIVKPGDSLLLPTQQFVYNLSSPVSSVISNSREVSGTADMYETVTYYDGLGRKLQSKAEGENSNWVVSEAVSFNQQKAIKKKWLPYFSDTMAYKTPNPALPHIIYEYDAKGRSVKETNPDSSYRATVYQPLIKIVSDEEDNNIVGIHTNTPHTFIYDGLQRLIEVHELNGAETYKTLYEYDGLNNLVKITDNEGNIKTMLFDGIGRKLEMNDPDKHHMGYSYDPAGNLVSTTDAKGQTASYTYDEASRIVTENYNGVKVRYHYDTDISADYPGLLNTRGKLTYVEDEAGREYYSYDERGNTILKIRETGGYAFGNRMEYDAMDRLSRFTYPDGYTQSYIYNSMNQLESVPGFITDIDYIATGQKERFTYANGIQSAYSYDNRQRMKKLLSEKEGHTLQDLNYGYDATNNIMQITDSRTFKTTEDLTRSFIYDDLYRLTKTMALSWMESYQYNSIGDMTFKSDVGTMTYGEGGAGPHALTKASGANIRYTYDENGNIASKEPGFTYQFDHKDRLVRADRISDGATITFTYDYNGNRITKNVTIGADTETTIYADKFTELRRGNMIKNIFAEDRLVARVFSPFAGDLFEIRTMPQIIQQFDRNPQDGHITLSEIMEQGADVSRLEKRELQDAFKVYYENAANGHDILSFATLAQGLYAFKNTPPLTGSEENAVYFYLPDHLGSASIVTDSDGGVVEESVYYPYGKDRARTGSFVSDYRFTGKELDDETGLHYFGARYYDSLTGRFVSVDPLYVENIGDMTNNPQGLNIYAYATNPVRFVDPNGLFWKEAVSVVKTVVVDAPLAVANSINKGVDKVADWGGERILNYVVGDTSNMDDKAKAAVYGATAEGISHTMDVTAKASVTAMISVATMGLGAPLAATGVYTGVGTLSSAIGGLSTVMELSSTFFEETGDYGLSKGLSIASTAIDIGSAVYNVKHYSHAYKKLLNLKQYAEKGRATSIKNVIKAGRDLYFEGKDLYEDYKDNK